MNNDNYFKSYYDLHTDDVEEFTHKIMKVAMKGEHKSLGLINNIAEYYDIRCLRIAQVKLVQGFKASRKSMYKNYLRELKEGTDNLQTLIDCKVFLECENFFKEELRVATDIMEEFEWYMLTGHFFKMLTGAERPYRDMKDSRKKQE